MKHLTLYASLLALAATAMPSWGRTDLTVSGSGTDDATFTVTDDMVIDFASQPGSLVVKSTATGSATFAVTDATVLTFTAVSGVGNISAAPQVALRHNPVESTLEFTAAPQQPSRLSVVSLQGATLLTAAGWQGESVDVSSLAPGLYIVNFNNQSLKFYKK